MSRTILKELDVLAGILAGQCVSIDRKQWDENGTMTVDKKAACKELKVHLFFDYLQNDYRVVLEESKNQDIDANLLKNVTLTGLHAETLVLRPDHFAVQHFKGGTWNKACDYLVLTRFAKTKYAVFIDLKTSIGREPGTDEELNFQGSEYDSGMVWQMLGADALFDNLIDVVYRSACSMNTTATSRVSALTNCGQTPLAQYKRRYLILYRTVIEHPNTTVGGVRSTGFIPPNDLLLERKVHVFHVGNHEALSMGALLACAGL